MSERHRLNFRGVQRTEELETGFLIHTRDRGAAYPTEVGGTSIPQRRSAQWTSDGRPTDWPYLARDFYNSFEQPSWPHLCCFNTLDGIPGYYLGLTDDLAMASPGSLDLVFGVNEDGSVVAVLTASFLFDMKIEETRASTGLACWQITDDVPGGAYNDHAAITGQLIGVGNDGVVYAGLLTRISATGVKTTHDPQYGFDAGTETVNSDNDLGASARLFVFADGTVAFIQGATTGPIYTYAAADLDNPVATLFEQGTSIYDSGTCGAGSTVDEVNLAFGGSSTDDEYNGMTLEINGDPSSRREITDYVGSTKRATLASSLDSAPVFTDAWVVYDLGDHAPINWLVWDMPDGDRSKLWLATSADQVAETGKLVRLVDSSLSELASTTDSRIGGGGTGDVPTHLGSSENGAFAAIVTGTILAPAWKISRIDSSGVVAHNSDLEALVGHTDIVDALAVASEAGDVFVAYERQAGDAHLVKLNAGLTAVSWTRELHDSGGTNLGGIKYCEVNAMVLVMGDTLRRDDGGSEAIPGAYSVIAFESDGDLAWNGRHTGSVRTGAGLTVANGRAWIGSGQVYPTMLEPGGRTGSGGYKTNSHTNPAL